MKAAFLALTFSATPLCAEERPWSDEVIYFVMLDRFADGVTANNQGVDTADPLAFHGGDLVGLREKLGEIADLGATAIWLTPIVAQIPTTVPSDHGPFAPHHGYWAEDFTRIDPRYGTEADLAALTSAAHARGMRVILDVVYNHVGYGADWTVTHPEWLRQGEDCGGDEITMCLAGLPDLRTELPEVREMLFEAHIGLAERVGLDGFRLDTVKHIPHDFWSAHAQEVRTRLGEDFLLLGEVWDGDKYLAAPYFEKGELDALFDFGFRDRTLKFLTGVEQADRFSRYLAKRHEVGDAGLLAPFLSNHDMPTLLAMLRGDRDRYLMAATLLLTIEGIPTIAWGEEIGRRGGVWPENREDMAWSGGYRDETLRDMFKQLIALRQAWPALQESPIEVIRAEKGLLAYRRGDLVVAINRSDDVVDLALGGGILFETREAGGRLAPMSAQVLHLPELR